MPGRLLGVRKEGEREKVKGEEGVGGAQIGRKGGVGGCVEGGYVEQCMYLRLLIRKVGILVGT